MVATQPQFVASPPAPRGIDKRSMSMLSFGHAFTDVNQGFVPALVPFLVAGQGMSYGEASLVVLAATVSSAIAQPVIGLLSDRRPLPWLIPVGIAMAGLGIGAAGVAPSFAALFVLVVVSGVGVAAFHPEAYRYANYASGDLRATGMSFFSVAGNAGFAAGPLVATALLVSLGLPGTVWLALPALIVSAILWRELPRFRAYRIAATAQHRAAGERPDQWRPFALLMALVSLRSMIFFGLVTFAPLYLIASFGLDKQAAATSASVLLFSGVVGTLIGGRLADRFGRRLVLIGSMAILIPCVLSFTALGVGFGWVFLALAGAVTVATFSVSVVLGQEYLPSRMGVASGVTTGLAIGIGGLAAPVLGVLADNFGVIAAMYALAALPAFGVVLALILPKLDGASAVSSIGQPADSVVGAHSVDSAVR